MSFSGKVILITGGSSGIGAETAVYFSKLGADVAITGRNLENLNKVSEKCEKKPFIIVAELTKERDAKNIIESVVRHFGKLDILINNAGILEHGSIENADIKQYDRVFEVNVRSVYYLTHIAVPHLIKTKGNIINVSSRAGLRSVPGFLTYCMSKSALDQFTRCTALDLGEYLIRVNSVNPGVILTDIFTRAGMSVQQQRELFERTKNNYPLKRVGLPIDVAKAIAFFASEDANFITGVTCSVDGGGHLLCK